MRRLYVVIGIGLVFIAILLWFVHYLSTGQVVITTNNKSATITLLRLDQGTPFTKVGLGSLSTSVIHGQYTATVTNGSQTTVQFINFQSGHHTFHYNLGYSGLANTEMVANANAADIVADANQISYVDATNNNIYKIDAQNNLSIVDAPSPIKNVKWADSSFGVGEDVAGNLYTIDHGSINALNVPFAANGKLVSFAVAANKQIYVSYGAAIYRGYAGGHFTKIYTANAAMPTLAASPLGVAIGDAGEGDEDSAKPVLVFINNNGKVIKQPLSVEVRQLAWSPEGHYLVSVNESYASVYDANLRQIDTLPNSSFSGGVAWLDSGNLFYAANNKLWTFDVINQRAKLLSIMPIGDTISDLSISSDKAYAYVTTLDSNSNYALQRVSLKNQPVSPVISQVQALLPHSENNYALGLINFTTPAIITVQPFANLDPTNDIAAAMSFLQTNNIDTSQLQFRLIAPAPMTD